MFTWKEMQNPTPFNDFKPLKTADLECFHCHKITRIPMVNVESKEAAHWREKYELLMGQLNSAIQDCRMLHGDDPMRIFFVKRMKEIRDEFSSGT
jgi:hypothetical protein